MCLCVCVSEGDRVVGCGCVEKKAKQKIHKIEREKGLFPLFDFSSLFVFVLEILLNTQNTNRFSHSCLFFPLFCRRPAFLDNSTHAVNFFLTLSLPKQTDTHAHNHRSLFYLSSRPTHTLPTNPPPHSSHTPPSGPPDH